METTEIKPSDGQRKLHLFGPGMWLLMVGGSCRSVGKRGLMW